MLLVDPCKFFVMSGSMIVDCYTEDADLSPKTPHFFLQILITSTTESLWWWYIQSLLIKSIKRYLFWPWPLGNRQLVLKQVLPLVCFESWDLRVLFTGSFLTQSVRVGKAPSTLSVCWGSAQETPMFVTGVLEGVSLFSCESVLFMSSWTMLQQLSCWMTCVFTGSDCHVDRTTCSRVCWNVYC